MNRQQALTKLIEIVTESDDPQALEVLGVVLDAQTAFPPTPLGHATHEAHRLAHQFAKTGWDSEWATPPAHSRAMERLVHRMTNVLEAMLNLMEEQRM